MSENLEEKVDEVNRIIFQLLDLVSLLNLASILEVGFDFCLYMICTLAFGIAGVIDADYRGNVAVVLFNHNDSDFISKTQTYSND